MRTWWLIMCGLLPAALAVAADPVRPDPLPLRRVYIGPERVHAELERMQKGTLVLLPKSEFEATVQEAAAALDVAQRLPRLLKTHYAARLTHQALVGSADWSVLQQGSGPGLLPLSDFNLAVTERPTIDSGAAILGELDGKTPALWIGQAGKHAVHFAWTRRAALASDGLHFDMQLPGCASARIDLELPTDYQLIADKNGVLVDGPLAAANKGFRSWALSFSGRTRLEFILRKLETGDAQLFAAVQSRQELGPERVQADFDFDIEALHGAVSQLLFHGSSGLQPYEVSLGGITVKNWEWQTPESSEKSTSSGVLTVPLREPLYGKLPAVRVRCLASLERDQTDHTWVSPGLRLEGALSRGEMLQLRILPEAQLESWNSGQFRLLKASGEADGSQLLTLVQGGPLPLTRSAPPLVNAGWAIGESLVNALQALLPQRPTAVLNVHRTQFLLDQRSWWQLDAHGSTLTCDMVCKPSRGQLYHLPLKLPPDSQVDKLSAEPKESIRSWVTKGSRQSPLLLIDFSQPGTPGTPVKIHLQLQLSPRPFPKTGSFYLDLPDIQPQLQKQQLCLREGALAVTVHPSWRAQVVQPSWPATGVTQGDGEGPWQRALTDYYFTFRGEPLTGKLRLVPRPPQFQAACDSDAFIGGSRGALVTRLTLEPSSGSLDYVDLIVSSPLAQPWSMRSESAGPRLAGVQRLPVPEVLSNLLALGASHDLEALSVLVAKPCMQRWRLRFAEPVSTRVTLLLEAAFDPVTNTANAGPSVQQAWAVPVVAVSGAEQFEGSLAVQVIGAEINGVKAQQLQELPQPADKVVATGGLQHLWRVYRYDSPGADGRQPSLQLKARTIAGELAGRETCESATLLTFVEPGGALVHHFRFQLSNWRKRDVPVLLPASSKVLGAQTAGRWLPALFQKEDGDNLQVDLPASVAVAVQHFDLYYSTNERVSTWSVWEKLAAPPPKLPVKPLALRHVWVLPPELAPVSGTWQRIMGSPDSDALIDQLPRWSWNLGQPLLSALSPQSETPDWETVQKQQLAAAEAGLRRQSGPPSKWVLGPVVEALALTQLPHHLPLVIDAAALASAGLSPESTFGGAASNIDPWASLRLAMVPTRGGLVLTTRQQHQIWAGSAETDGGVPGAIVQAVAEAAQRGHDNTGRFCSAIFWVQRGPQTKTASVSERAPVRDILLPESFGPDWTQWESPAHSEPGLQIVVVRPAALTIVGLLISGLFIAVCIIAARRGRSAAGQPWRVRCLVLWAALAAVAVLWLPAPLRALAAWPAGTALAFGAGWYVLTSRQRQSLSEALVPNGATSAATAMGLGLAVVLAAGSLPLAWSQNTDPSTVLVLPGTPEAPNRQDVLVTPELLKNLDALIQRDPARLERAVLTGAHYEGAVQGEIARFKVDYALYNFGNKTTLTVPLGGVELSEGALLDGVAVQPEAAGGGYTVRVEGHGPHRLTLQFTVRFQMLEGNRDLQYTVPRILQSTMRLRLPAAWPEALTVPGLGQAQSAQLDVENQQLTIDLGRESTVHFRWPGTRSGGASIAKVTVSEAYFWDLFSPGSECTAVLKYTVQGSSVAQLTVAIPDMVEPRQVEVAVEGSGGDNPAKPKSARWTMAEEAGQRQVRVQLQEPATGELLVTLHLVPRYLLGAGMVRLALPLPIDVKSTGGIVGYRVPAGLEATDKTSDMMTLVLPADQFANQWRTFSRIEIAPATRSLGIRSRNAEAALLVTLTARRPLFQQELLWTFYPGRADLTATLKAEASSEELMLIEWDVPSKVTIAEIAGDNIRSWERTAGQDKVQIWLEQPARTASFELRGWTLQANAKAKAAVHWALPWLRCPHAATTRTIIRVAEGGGIRVDADPRKFSNLTALSGPASSSWVCQGPETFYGGEFVLRPVSLPARVTAVTTVDVQGDFEHLLSQWQVHVPQSGAAKFFFRVDGWQGSPLKLEGSAEMAILRTPPKGQQRWQITIPQGAARRLHLKLTGTKACPPGAIVKLPSFHLITGAVWGDHWVAVRQPALALRMASGLSEIKDLSAEPGLPPAAADRLGQQFRVWKAATPDWKLTVVAQPRAAAPSFELLLAEQKVAFGEGFGWIHQAGYWIHAKDANELTITMPAGALLQTASVNGEQVNPRYVAPDQLAVVLPTGEGFHRLLLRWMFAPHAELIWQPKLAAPRLEGVAGQPANWTLTIPFGYCLPDGAAALDQSPPMDVASQELSRAEAQLAAVQALAQQFKKSKDTALRAQTITYQAQFYRHLRLAGNALEIDSDAATSAVSANLKEQMARLEQRNEAFSKSVGLEEIRENAQKARLPADSESDAAMLTWRGTVVRWRGGALDRPNELTLVAADVDWVRRAWVATGGVVLAALVVLVLSSWPRVVGWLQLLWPEEIAALAVVGCLMWGVSLVGIALLTVAVGVRGWWLVGRMRRWRAAGEGAA